jgi:predicted site-specific integrase-resolvase
MQNEIAIYTIGEAAEMLGISTKSVKNFITAGKLEAFTVSDTKAERLHLRVTAEALRKFIKSQTITGD